jgi:hypothetical protein
MCIRSARLENQASLNRSGKPYHYSNYAYFPLPSLDFAYLVRFNVHFFRYRCIVKVKVKLKLPLCLTKHQAMKTLEKVEMYLHAFFDLGTRWRWVGQLYKAAALLPGKEPQYPLDRRLGGPQDQTGHGVLREKFPSSVGNRTPIMQPVSQSLRRLSCPCFQMYCCKAKLTRHTLHKSINYVSLYLIKYLPYRKLFHIKVSRDLKWDLRFTPFIGPLFGLLKESAVVRIDLRVN